MKTWQRYFVFEFTKTLLFVLCVIFVLYSLIDFSSRRSVFYAEGISFSWLEFLWHYLCSFSKELTVLLPFSAMITVIKCVSDLKSHHELVAMLASGISLRRLLLPFFLIGVALSLVSLANQEFFYPKAMRSIHQVTAKKRPGAKEEKTLSRPSKAPICRITRAFCTHHMTKRQGP